MRYPQIVVFESDGQLGRQLKPLSEAERWVLREPRQLDTLLREVHAELPTVLVVKLGKPDPQRELKLLSRIAVECPRVSTVAVGDVEDAAILAGLAWDLGVDFALFPPLSRDLLPEIVAGLMKREVPA